MRFNFLKHFFFFLIQVCILNSGFCQPIINSFTPSSGPVGSNVIITGTGFSAIASYNSVYFGAVKATVLAATTTSLSVIVPVEANYAPITVTTQNLTCYSEKPFVVTFPGSTNSFPKNLFTGYGKFNTGKQFKNIAYGGYFVLSDFDGDGKVDMVSASPDSDKNSIFLFKNTSTANNIQFASKELLDTTASSIALTCADFNGDGKQDIIFNTYGSNIIKVLINYSTIGNIVFKPVAINLSENPGSFLIYDIDGDGKPDIAGTTGYDNNTFHLCIFKNTGLGNNLSFAPSINIKTASFNRLKVGDLNGDRKPEMILLGSYSATVYKNESTPGNIQFDKALSFETSYLSSYFALGDLNKDDKPDIAIADNQKGTFSVLRNTSINDNISFAKAQSFAVGRFPQGIAIGDIDGDGEPDVAVTDNNGTGRSATLFKNRSTQGKLNFGSGLDFNTSEAPAQVYIADLDGDSKPEIATIQDELSICILIRCAVVNIVNQPADTAVCKNSNAAFSIVVKTQMVTSGR